MSRGLIIRRPAIGTITSVGGRPHPAPVTASRRGRTPAGAQWLDDQRRAGKTAKLVLDTKIELARVDGLLPRRC